MIGNDVVDLREAGMQSNRRRKGFLEKVFRSSELEFIASSDNPDRIVWLLWSMKEAAYKANQRLFDLSRKLNWKDQECEIDELSKSVASGKVRINEYEYFTCSSLSERSVFTSAVRYRDTRVTNGFFEEQGSAKKQLYREISRRFSLDPEDLSLEKNRNGIPFIAHAGRRFYSAFSLTGHGKFSAYSLPLMNS